ncbi:hypothetical protein CUMW_158870 [Citrus unshiu]|uniref:mitogen-activated protein kinase n=1 Tax=Citrus unshiu TaxID=55188 RepID=A0A2H5PQS8_CITUN|nr:hypothetical protein CUMW_158870 [Citrus unshiu]
MTLIALKLDLSPDYDAVQEKKIIGGAGVDSSLLTQDSKTRSLLDLHKFTSNILYNIILSLSSDFRVLGDKISMFDKEFFTEYGEASQYEIQEIIGIGSYGVVASAIDTHTGEKVAIKKMKEVFEHVSDATRILREIKLLRMLKHPDIVEIKHIMLPPCRREFKDIYVVFELMESDLDQPKNILANADCKLKICDFGLARVSFTDTPSAIFWTDYVATRWYRAPELCGSFFSKYTPAIDIWSIGCIFAELLTGRPLFPGRNVAHQLDLVTDLLGTPSAESIAGIRNEKAKRYLSSLRRKWAVPFSHKFPGADPLALRLLQRLLAFDPKDRPSAEEIRFTEIVFNWLFLYFYVLADPYFHGLANLEEEPSRKPISKLVFEFERRKLIKDDVRELIYREILEYHPHMLEEYLQGTDHTHFMYPSGVDQFKQQFARLEEQYGKRERHIPLRRKYTSLPRERISTSEDEATDQTDSLKKRTASVTRATLQSPPSLPRFAELQSARGNSLTMQHGSSSQKCGVLLRSDSMSASKCVGVNGKYCD